MWQSIFDSHANSRQSIHNLLHSGKVLKGKHDSSWKTYNTSSYQDSRLKLCTFLCKIVLINYHRTFTYMKLSKSSTLMAYNPATSEFKRSGWLPMLWIREPETMFYCLFLEQNQQSEKHVPIIHILCISKKLSK